VTKTRKYGPVKYDGTFWISDKQLAVQILMRKWTSSSAGENLIVCQNKFRANG